MAATLAARHLTRESLPWWGCEAALESLDDIARVRGRVRSRLAGQRGVRVVDILLILDVLVLDALDCGFAQRDLRLKITSCGSRLVVTLEGVDAPATIGSALAQSAGPVLLDMISTDWGVQRRCGRKSTWVAIDTAERPGWRRYRSSPPAAPPAILRAIPCTGARNATSVRADEYAHVRPPTSVRTREDEHTRTDGGITPGTVYTWA